MSVANVYTGITGDIRYGKESAFKAGSDSDLTRRFGLGQKLTRMEWAREYEDVYQVGNRQIVTILPKQRQYRLGVEAFLTDHKHLGLILKPVTDSNGNVTGYEYTAVPDTHVVGVLLATPTGSSNLELFKGAVATSMSIEVRAGEAVKYSVEMVAAERATGGTLPTAEDEPMIYAAFANGSTVSIGGLVGYVRSLTLTIRNEAELVWTLGSPDAATWVPTRYQVELSGSALFLGTDIVDRHLEGTATTALFTVADVNGGGSLTFSLTGDVKVVSASTRLESPNVAELSFTVRASGVSVTVS